MLYALSVISGKILKTLQMYQYQFTPFSRFYTTELIISVNLDLPLQSFENHTCIHSQTYVDFSKYRF